MIHSPITAADVALSKPVTITPVGMAPAGMADACRGCRSGAPLAAVDLLTGPDAVRIKRCPVEQGGCGWVFVDRSRNSSRTWCRMADCGTAVKARRLTERRRQARAAER